MSGQRRKPCGVWAANKLRAVLGAANGATIGRERLIVSMTGTRRQHGVGSIERGNDAVDDGIFRDDRPCAIVNENEIGMQLPPSASSPFKHGKLPRRAAR